MHGSTQRHARWGLAPLLAALALFGWVREAAAAVPEYELKAVLIYKVAKFVRWPEGTFVAGSPGMHLCIVGRDDFGASLDALAGQKLKDQVISVRRLPGTAPDAAGCQIVFVSRSERDNVAAVLAELASLPVLTISDIEGFAGDGGMIEFATDGTTIHFVINAAASRRTGLEIGAQLLQLATLIADSRPGNKP